MQEIDDDNKRKIVANIYMNSKLGMIYGAAGTGKTRVAEYIAKIFEDKNILLLANTNAAKNNLERRIKSSCDCYTVYDYLKNGYSWKKYDLVILDECSTVCNEDVLNLFEKCNAEAYLLIGDIYQIEVLIISDINSLNCSKKIQSYFSKIILISFSIFLCSSSCLLHTIFPLEVNSSTKLFMLIFFFLTQPFFSNKLTNCVMALRLTFSFLAYSIRV